MYFLPGTVVVLRHEQDEDHYWQTRMTVGVHRGGAVAVYWTDSDHHLQSATLPEDVLVKVED